MSSQLVILALSAATFFALALVLTQFGLRRLSPLDGASISIPTTAAAFVATSPFLADFGGWRLEGAVPFALAGLFFPVAVTLLTFASNRSLGPTLTGALGNLTPLFAVAGAIAMIGDAPSTPQIAGIAAIFVGAIVLYLGRPLHAHASSNIAFLLPIAAALLRGLAQPLVKLGLAAWPNPFAASTIGYVVSATIVVAIRTAARRTTGRRDFRGILWFAAVGLCNGAAVWATYAALARGPVTLVAPLVATYPLATLLLERAVMRDAPIRPAAIGGVIAVIGGVVILVGS